MQTFEKFLETVLATYVKKVEEDALDRKKENPDAVAPNWFRVEKKAGELVEASRKQGIHHRERELFYTEELEKAEKDLRENGVSMELYDPTKGTFLQAVSNSGSLCSGSIGNYGNGNTQAFQPRVDQVKLDKVKTMKEKMLEHRGKAEQYEKYARAYALAPDTKILLGIEDVHYFRLETV